MRYLEIQPIGSPVVQRIFAGYDGWDESDDPRCGFCGSRLHPVQLCPLKAKPVPIGDVDDDLDP